MPDCPPPPPPPVEVHTDAPTAEVPLVTLEWLARRDAHAEAVTACYLDQRATLTLTEAERDAAVWLAEQRAAQVAGLEAEKAPRVVASVASVLVGGALTGAGVALHAKRPQLGTGLAGAGVGLAVGGGVSLWW